MENERLQQRVAQLRAQAQALEGSSDSFFTSSDNFGAADGARPGYDAGATPDVEDDGPRKKVCLGTCCVASFKEYSLTILQVKRMAAEQHVCVTCGRTDSPEWRKVCRQFLGCARLRSSCSLGSYGSEDPLQCLRPEVGEEGTQGRRGG